MIASCIFVVAMQTCEAKSGNGVASATSKVTITNISPGWSLVKQSIVDDGTDNSDTTFIGNYNLAGTTNPLVNVKVDSGANPPKREGTITYTYAFIQNPGISLGMQYDTNAELILSAANLGQKAHGKISDEHGDSTGYAQGTFLDNTVNGRLGNANPKSGATFILSGDNPYVIITVEADASTPSPST